MKSLLKTGLQILVSALIFCFVCSGSFTGHSRTIQKSNKSPQIEIVPENKEFGNPIQNREMWDLQFAYEINTPGYDFNQAVTCDGEHFYIADFTSPDIRMFDLAMNYLGFFAVPGISAYRDLAWDGNYLYACNNTPYIYEIDIATQTLVSTISTPANVRTLAYDHGQDAFWINNWTNDLMLIDRSGTLLNSFPVQFTIAGMDYDDFSGVSQFLWLLTEDGLGAKIVQWDISSGNQTGVEHYIGEEFGYENMAISLFVEQGIVAGSITLGGIVQTNPPQVYGYELYTETGPVINVIPDSIILFVNPDSITQGNISISNTGDADLTYNIEVQYITMVDEAIRVDPKEYATALARRMEEQGINYGSAEVDPGRIPGSVSSSDDIFDLLFEYPVGVGGGEAGIETDGNYIYTTKWNGTGFYRYEMDGTYLEHFEVSGISCVRDLAYDGTYFYGGAASTTVYEMDFDGQTLISSFGAPVDVRAIAYNDAEEGFYANNWSTDITLFDRSGSVLNSFGVGAYESFYGFAYYNYFFSTFLWGYSQDGSGNLLVQYNLPDGTAISDFDMMAILTLPSPGDIAGGLFIQPEIVPYTWTLGGLVQNVCLWGIEIGTTIVVPNDVGVWAFVSPTSGPNLTTTEIVTVKVKNYGFNTQSNIPVSYTLDGGTSVTGTIAGPIAPGESVEYTFAGTVDLSDPGQTYVFVGCTALASDENPDNDCKTACITYVIPTYCIPTANCSYGDGFTDFTIADISNLGSGCSPDGYGDFTYMSTAIEAGNTYDATMASGYNEQFVCLWIDFNKDSIFQDEERLITDFEMTTAGQMYTTQITVPYNVPNVTTRMRIRANWQNSATDPCANFSYGETEDYTVDITGGGGWLALNPISGIVPPGDTDLINFTVDAGGLYGVYFANIIISNNSPNTPVNIPVTIIVDSIIDPTIVIEPMSLEETLWAGQMSIQQLTVTNIGQEPLNFDIEVVTNPVADPVQIDPEEYYTKLLERMETEGIGFSDAEAAPGVVPGAINYTDDDYDLQFEYPVGVGGGEAGIETDGSYIYTTKWNGDALYKYSYDGTYLGEFSIPGVSQIRDLAYDGTYFYGGAASTTVYEMDFDGQTLISSFGAPVDVRAIAYDDAEDGFYANNWSTDITLFDRSGSVLNSFGVGAYESFYGFAYDIQGPYLWGYSQGGSGNLLVQYNLPDGTALSIFDMMAILTMPLAGDIAGGLFMHQDIVPGTWTLGGLVQNVCLWGIDMTTLIPIYNDDVGVWAFVSPTSGPVLTTTEIVTVKVKNYGFNTQSNIPVSYTLDGGTPVTGIVAGPIAPNESVEYTFAGTVDLSDPGQSYLFVGCTALAGDENPDNDCKTMLIIYIIPTYCIPTANCSYGDGFTDFTMADISNLGSGCSENGYGDFTEMSTELIAGTTYDVNMASGYNEQFVCLWIDFNKDSTFQDEERLITDFEMTTAGQMYTTQITIPCNVPNFTTRMRIRANWQNSAADPCANFSYGETEDYTVVIGSYGPTWLSAIPLSGTLNQNESMTIYVTFDTDELAIISYYGELIFTSNDPNNPIVEVPVILHVTDGCPYPPPTNLFAWENPAYTVNLTWEEPQPPGVIRWDDGINNDGIGLTDGGTFLVAARWEGTQLTEYDGFFLTHVDMFPRSELGTVFTLKIWKDPNAATLVVSQALPNITQNEWNTIELETPVQIDATTELWIGYECADQPAGDYPAGCDAGPAVAGFGDMINLDGTNWESMSLMIYGLDYNWNIAGIINIATDGKPLAKPLAIGQTNYNNKGFVPIAGNLGVTANAIYEGSSRELLGYNIYRDNDKINEELVIETYYTDEVVLVSDYKYNVTAVYTLCESIFSEPAYITVTGINELVTSSISIYPNPATDIVNIESGINISYIRILNNAGQIVYEKYVGKKFVQINTSSFETGIYFIRVETKNGLVTEKMIIQ